MAEQTARGLALTALARIGEGAYANLVLPGMLDRSRLSHRDRALATELVYGTTRMRRACDWLVDRFLMHPPEPAARDALRLGAYQLVFLRIPSHAAVSATVAEVHGRTRGMVNAVLRRVAAAGTPTWPDLATGLSYPDWIVERLVADLGEAPAVAALERMNEAPTVTERPDGYIQDDASRWVAEYVGAAAGERVADICAAPGGKATLLGHAGADLVVAADLQPQRAALIAENAARVQTPNVAAVVADGRRPPIKPASLHRVLVDAPCSGLGVLRRRADARWRIEPGDVEDLAELQRRLLLSAAALVRPGGRLVYSVCTLTRAESASIDNWAAAALPQFRPTPPPPAPWEPVGRGARLLPQSADTDGMYVLGLQRSPGEATR